MTKSTSAEATDIINVAQHIARQNKVSLQEALLALSIACTNYKLDKISDQLDKFFEHESVN